MRNTIPKPKDILAMVDWSNSGYEDLYSGYSKDPLDTDTCYFDSEWHANEWADTVQAIFDALKSEKVIPVYRTIYLADLSDLREDFLGSSWSWEKRAALNFGRQGGCNYLLTGTAKSSQVDWWASVALYIDNSQFYEYEDEFELAIPSGQVDNLTVEKIR